MYIVTYIIVNLLTDSLNISNSGIYFITILENNCLKTVIGLARMYGINGNQRYFHLQML